MLSRTRLTSKYGDFNRLMEARDEHGGYGDVTWNVGPHAGPQPYGPDHHVVFVDRNKLLAGHKPQRPEEVARHMQGIGQQMERGDVIHVPHVQFKGSAPAFDDKHLASIHAAAQRGAEKIPVVANKNDHMALMMHVGGAEKPGAALPKQDKNFKWRWNGRAWYTKPSFNQGKCPQGTGADAAKDQCIGGGAPPQAAPVRDKTPAALFGSQSLPPGRELENPFPGKMKVARKVQPRAAAPVAPAAPRPPRAPRPKPEPVASPPPAAPAGPLPEPVSKSDVVQHTAIRDGIGLDRRIFAGRDQVQASMKKSGALAAEALKQIAPHLKIGQMYGCGLSGCAYAGPEDPDGTPTVVKMDKGENEATMAKLLLKHKDLGRLSSVPRYIQSIDTGVVDKHTGMRVHAIHREDLRDFNYREENVKEFFGSFGMTLHDLSSSASSYNRNELLAKYAKIESKFHKLAARDPNIAKQFARVTADTKQLISRGIVPCDVHHENWGIREKTGEVVMRDVGCSHFSKDLAA